MLRAGMGKTCCGSLHICRCLVLGRTVILEICGGGEDYRFYKMKLGGKRRAFLFNLFLTPRSASTPSYSAVPAEVVVASRHWETFCKELADKEVCYFTDGGLPSECSSPSSSLGRTRAWGSGLNTLAGFI